jgi:hypothetical protein
MEHSPAENSGIREMLYHRRLWKVYRAGLNIVSLDVHSDQWARLEAMAPEDRRIDIWWFNDASSRLMLLLAYLMTRNPFWEESTIRVMAPAGSGSPKNVKDMLKNNLMTTALKPIHGSWKMQLKQKRKWPT